MKAWDIGGRKRHYEIGSTRFLAEWSETRDGHECDDSCEDLGLMECFESKARPFPTEPLAAAFARKNPGVWGGTVVRQDFEHAGSDCGHALGSWENVGETELVE